MCRGRRARILLHLHIQLKGAVLRGKSLYARKAQARELTVVCWSRKGV
jgi:hypothetical protein